MRGRRKKHLEEKLAAFENLIDTPPVTQDYRLEAAEPQYLDLPRLFGRAAPLELEIGCGKGQFICTLAARRPETDFLAVEVCRNVLADACKRAAEMGLKNVVFLHCNAAVLQKYLPPASVSRLYLNFSCPYPKKTYANRRLTHARFLELYAALLAPGAEIHQKTDNMHFFEFSLEQFSQAGFRLKNVSLDLHNSAFEGNIETEYEKKFSEKGFPIYRLEAYLEETGK